MVTRKATRWTRSFECKIICQHLASYVELEYSSFDVCSLNEYPKSRRNSQQVTKLLETCGSNLVTGVCFLSY